MAQDWVRMRLDLDEDPAVIQMAQQMGIDEICVVGYCWKIWSWVQRQCNAASVTNVTLESLGRVTRTGNFPRLMAQVGWLETDGNGGFVIPKYERWLSQTAKARALASERVKRHRSLNPSKKVKRQCNAESVTLSPSISISNKSTKEGGAGETSQQRFKAIPPSLADVQARIAERGLRIDADKFLAYYEARGWKLRTGPVKNWDALLTTWSKTQFDVEHTQSNGAKRVKHLDRSTERVLFVTKLRKGGADLSESEIEKRFEEHWKRCQATAKS